MGNTHTNPVIPPPPEKVEDNNPGSFEELHDKCQNVFPECFDGARLILTKHLSNQFQVEHTINIGTLSPSGYHFATSYTGKNQTHPILLGAIDPNGNLNATIAHQMARLQTKFSTSTQQSKYTTTQLSVGYHGNDYTAGATITNPNPIDLEGILILQYLQKVTDTIALGAELTYHNNEQQMALINCAVRYATENLHITANCKTNNLHLCFYKRASSQLQFGIELESDFNQQRAVTRFGYQVDLSKDSLIFKGSIDSNWMIGAVLEKRLNPLPINLQISALLHQRKDQFRLGIGIVVL